ncbi:dynein regulatory complex protein 9-like [Bemisia tabaci]|uniref:dynein regulatory complex protein 9-like n=1 Tax=Bemisia tabaci TaxID=7038 RepID=UPI003B288022
MALKFQNPIEIASLVCVLEDAVKKLIIVEKLHKPAVRANSQRGNAFLTRNSTTQILRITRDELLESGSYRCLKAYVQKQSNQQHKNANLNESHSQVLVEIKNAKKSIEDITRSGKQALQEETNTISEIVDDIQGELSCNAARMSLAERWEDAREQQNMFKCQMEEAKIETKVQEAVAAIDSEHRVDAEIENYLHLAIAKLKDEIENWTKRYDEEIAEREAELASLMETRNAALEKLERLNSEFTGRQKEIEDYLATKEDLRRSKEREEYLNKMATKIQAWWRGTMYP